MPLLFIVAAGLATGVIAFASTGSYPQRGYLGPICNTGIVRDAGFDPWTGEPVGAIYRCDPTAAGDPPSHLVPIQLPDDLVGRRAVPIPIGFAFGALVAAPVVFLVRRRKVAETGSV